MKNKRDGIIPIINIVPQNLNSGESNSGEYLTLINYTEINSQLSIDLKKENPEFNKEVLSTSFKDSKINPDVSSIDTSKLPVPNQSLAKNKVKYITSIPIYKELVLPLPEDYNNPNPTKLQIIKTDVNSGKWFLNTCIFQNTSIIMPEDTSTLNNSGSKINNELKFKMFFNYEIDFECYNQNGELISTSFEFTFKFIFNTLFLSSFITTFEYFENDLINFLKDNINIILKIEDKNQITSNRLSYYLTDGNDLKITNLNLKNFKIIKDISFYFDFETFKNSEKLYECILKLIPQDYTSLISIEADGFDNKLIQENMNNFYQSFTNENIKLFEDFIITDIINKSEEINILNITTDLNKDSNQEDPDYLKLKEFITNNLINFITEYEIFPNNNEIVSIPTEISYNLYNNKLLDIGKKQIIIRFNNPIKLNSEIYSNIFVIQYNILENRLEVVPISKSLLLYKL